MSVVRSDDGIWGTLMLRYSGQTVSTVRNFPSKCPTTATTVARLGVHVGPRRCSRIRGADCQSAE
eukprot:5778710-Prymnesium_polylepis.1